MPIDFDFEPILKYVLSLLNPGPTSIHHFGYFVIVAIDKDMMPPFGSE